MLHLVGRRPLCNTCISFWWDVPLLVNPSERDWLSVRTVMLVCFEDFVSSSVKFERNIAESQVSDMASVSAARVESATCHNLVEFHERGTKLLYLLFKKMIYPPWLPLSRVFPTGGIPPISQAFAHPTPHHHQMFVPPIPTPTKGHSPHYIIFWMVKITPRQIPTPNKRIPPLHYTALHCNPLTP